MNYELRIMNHEHPCYEIPFQCTHNSNLRYAPNDCCLIPNLEKAALWAAFSLLTNTELFDDCTIALDVFLLEIVEQATTLTYQRG